MKIAKNIPIYKSGEKDIFNNYRPISLLPALSKIMEKIVANRLVNYFNRCDLFYKHQYGFRKKHSTIHPIIHFLNHIANQKDISSKNITAAIFLDRKLSIRLATKYYLKNWNIMTPSVGSLFTLQI